MATIAWDVDGSRFYETGVSKGVLFPYDATSKTFKDATPWNGLTSVTETPGGAEANDLWADDMKYGSLRSAETLSGSIEAYTYPDAWAECDGSQAIAGGVMVGQQTRKKFALAYTTQVGSDEFNADSADDNYKLHLLYNATASPSDRQYQTMNDSPDAMTMSWEYETTAVKFTKHPNLKPTSLITIETVKLKKQDGSKKLEGAEMGALMYAFKKLEAFIYDDTKFLPSPEQIVEFFEKAAASDATASKIDAAASFGENVSG